MIICILDTCVVLVFLSVLVGALELEVKSADEALGWLEAGNTARVTAATCMNQRSSRSHAVFTLHVGEFSQVCMSVCIRSTFHCVTRATMESRHCRGGCEGCKQPEWKGGPCD